jgi:hypothetical protein
VRAGLAKLDLLGLILPSKVVIALVGDGRRASVWGNLEGA